MLNLTADLPTDADIPASTADAAAELLFVRADGTRLRANFVGLDRRSGLSLLEVADPLETLTKARISEAGAPQFAVGQRVRVITPVLATPTANTELDSLKAETANPMAINDGAPIGETGVTYMNMGEAAGELRYIKRSRSGRPVGLTLISDRISPEWAGGVALSESGALVGIVEASDYRQAQLAPAETVYGAATRVRARRAGIPQPWLGVRGETISSTSFSALTARGWSVTDARAMRAAKAGLLVSEVAPGTPAANAGLRSGDVIRRIGVHEVQTNDDVSALLDELGGNAMARFLILRPSRPHTSLVVTLRLSEAVNPALATAQAELRAAQSDARAAEASQAGRSSTGTRETGMAVAWAHVRLDVARQRVREASAADANPVNRVLLPYGLRVANVPANLAARFGTRDGLLVVGVRLTSPAAAGGMRAGDVIEKIDGWAVSALESRPEALTGGHTLTLGFVRARQSVAVKLTLPGVVR